MADEVDKANEVAELYLQDALEHRPKPTPIPLGIGMCLWCKSTVRGPGRWCSPECRDEWDLNNRITNDQT
jgi:hypothetical protein